MQQPNKHYVYFPIDTEKHEIRLFIIDSGEESEQISCALVKASISEPPPYKALSYTWGASDRSQQQCFAQQRNFLDYVSHATFT